MMAIRQSSSNARWPKSANRWNSSFSYAMWRSKFSPSGIFFAQTHQTDLITNCGLFVVFFQSRPALFDRWFASQMTILVLLFKPMIARASLSFTNHSSYACWAVARTAKAAASVVTVVSGLVTGSSHIIFHNFSLLGTFPCEISSWRSSNCSILRMWF